MRRSKEKRGMGMDIQLLIVAVAVVGAVFYMVRRAKKARQGHCSCGCGGCDKGCGPKGM